MLFNPCQRIYSKSDQPEVQALEQEEQDKLESHITNSRLCQILIDVEKVTMSGLEMVKYVL